MDDNAGDDNGPVPFVKSMLHGKVIQSQSREIVANVFAFMKREAESGQQIPLRCVTKRVIAATGVSERSVRRIQREAEVVYAGGAASFTSPRSKKRRKPKVLKVKTKLSQLGEESSYKSVSKQNSRSKDNKSKKTITTMLYPSLEDMKVDQLARAQRPYDASEAFTHQQRSLGMPSNSIPQASSSVLGSVGLYPSMVQQTPIPNLVASAPPPYSMIPSAPQGAHGVLAPVVSQHGPGTRQYHTAIYPTLNDYMGLDLSSEALAENMPGCAPTAGLSLQPVSSLAPTVGGMVAPLSGQSVGLQRAQVTHGIRELTVCKDAEGKVGLRVQAVSNGVFVCVVVKGSPAALAGLRFGDQILQVNGVIVAGYTMEQVHKLFKDSPINGISVVVRDRPFERTVTLHKNSTGHVGFHFKDGKIVGLVQDSSAARNGLLTDHHVLEVNGQNVVGVPDKDITAIINEGGMTITITIIPSFVFDHMVKKMSSSLLKTAMDHSIPNV